MIGFLARLRTDYWITNLLPALEFTLLPPKISVDQDCYAVVGGAPSTVTINGEPAPMWQVIMLPAGAEVKIRLGYHGCRVYLCIAGGGLQAGSEKNQFMPVGDPCAATIGRQRKETRTAQLWTPRRGYVRATLGPEFDSSYAAQLKQAWRVGARSSGMGVRLEGEPLALPSRDIESAPVQDGTVQATGEGLIALLRERGTLGGYPRVASIIDCDVDRVAQLRQVTIFV